MAKEIALISDISSSLKKSRTSSLDTSTAFNLTRLLSEQNLTCKHICEYNTKNTKIYILPALPVFINITCPVTRLIPIAFNALPSFSLQPDVLYSFHEISKYHLGI